MKVERIEEVTARFNVTNNTIWRWSRDTDFPKPFKLEGITVWDAADIDQWVLTRKQKQQSEVIQ